MFSNNAHIPKKILNTGEKKATRYNGKKKTNEIPYKSIFLKISIFIFNEYIPAIKQTADNTANPITEKILRTVRLFFILSILYRKWLLSDTLLYFISFKISLIIFFPKIAISN